MDELWKPVVGYEGLYEVSSHGRVRSFPRGKIPGRIMKIWRHSGGYRTLNLCTHGKKRAFTIHTLVAEAFLKRPPHECEVNHINGDKTDNNSSNLEWCTHLENIRHSWETGLIAGGERHSGAKLSIEQVRMIRELVARGIQHTDIASQFNVTSSNIGRIARGRSWAGII